MFSKFFASWNGKRIAMFALGGALGAIAAVVPPVAFILPVLGKVTLTTVLAGAAGALTGGAVTPPGTTAKDKK